MATVVVMATAQLSEAGDTPIGNQQSGRSASEFISSDGRIDLEALRRADYQGPLALEGADPFIDPATGEPAFRHAVASAAADTADDVYWDNSVSPSLPGVDWTVNALAVFDGKLVLAGNFNIVGHLEAAAIAA